MTRFFLLPMRAASTRRNLDKLWSRARRALLITVDTVLLDPVQSQANRMELALLRAYDAGKIKMPMLQVDFVGEMSDPILTEIGANHGAGSAAPDL